MPNESIFHRIVSSENSYTQLLCNTLKREPSLLVDLLDLAKIKLKDTIKPEDIRPQVRLNDCGQADLIIQSDTLTVIFEVKIRPQRPLEASQKLDGDRPGYKDWLKEKKAEEHDVWLVYLVPGDWKYRPNNDEVIEEYRRSKGQLAINVRQIYWDDVLRLFSKGDSRATGPLIVEFVLLLMEGFDPIKFASKEIVRMFTSEFPMETLIKLNAILEGLRKRAGKEAESESVSYEFGFYLTKGKRKLIFVGLSREFWDAGHHYPICFGVDDEDARVKEAFCLAFRKAYNQEPISIAEMEMTIGWVPQEEFNRFETTDATNEIWAKLGPIWDNVKKASAESQLMKPASRP
jgi:hypothetical protein